MLVGITVHAAAKNEFGTLIVSLKAGDHGPLWAIAGCTPRNCMMKPFVIHRIYPLWLRHKYRDGLCSLLLDETH